MIRGVPRCGDGFHGPTWARQDLPAAAEADIGLETIICASLSDDAILGLGDFYGAAINGRASLFLKWPCQGRVISVVMGDQYVGDGLPSRRREYGVQMLGQVRAWINHGDLAAADDIGTCTQIGEGARVVGDDPPDQGRDLITDTVFEFNLADIGDHGQVLQGRVQ